MQSSEKRTFLFLAVLLIAVGSASARHLEKRQAQIAKVNSFQAFLSKLDEYGKTPVIGTMISPYLSRAKNLLSTIDSRTDGSFSSVVNSVMPCNLVNNRIKCEGQIDKGSAQTLAKKLIDLVPTTILPVSMASMLKLATELL